MASIVQKKKTASINYVNNLLVLASVKLATTENLEATYSNGTSGIGATLTSNSSETLTIDSVSPAIGSRILVKDQSTTAENGIYSVTTTGGESSSYVLTRTSDFNTLTTIKLSDFVFIDSGTTHQGQGFVMIGNSSFDGTLDGGATIGTTSITFTQFTDTNTTYTAGNGLDLTGKTFSVDLKANGGLTIDSTELTIDTSGDVQIKNLGVGKAAPTEGTGEIEALGDIIAFASSDKRLKTNIQKIQDPLTKLQKIGGYTFDWIPKEGIHSHTGNDIGVIAQEIEEVLPEITTTRDNGYKAVKYEKLTAYLIECVKAQQTHIQQLEDRLVKLEKKD